MMSYIYTLIVESQNPSSTPASFLIRNAKKVFLWLIGGPGGQELLAAASVVKRLYAMDFARTKPDHTATIKGISLSTQEPCQIFLLLVYPNAVSTKIFVKCVSAVILTLS